MSRVPDSRTAGEESRRFLKDFDRQIVVYEWRDCSYPWTTNENDVAEDAIIVGIAGTNTEMLAGGLSYVDPVASIYWCAGVTRQGIFNAGGEMGPWQVPDAFDRAHALRQRMGYGRVVVTLEEVGIWIPSWGRLAAQEGY